MAVTYLQLLNRVLRNISESEIDTALTALNTPYTKLIGNFVNTIKAEVEAAHNWRALRVTSTVTVPALAASAAITWANENSRVVRVQQASALEEVPLVFDITDAANPSPLMEIDIAEYVYRSSMDSTSTAASPSYFAIDNAAGDVVTLYVWPEPTTQRTIQLTLVVPQDRLEDDDLGTTISVPVTPIEMGATWYALEERGEELGTRTLFSEARYLSTLNSHISLDLAEQGEADLVPT